jgi:hypothetical protein
LPLRTSSPVQMRSMRMGEFLGKGGRPDYQEKWNSVRCL